MIWHYFPIGFRFPVNDFSAETKAACWRTAISALIASGGSGVTLYDAQENYDYGSDGPVYICIACFYGVKQSRAVAKRLYELDRLMIELCLHRPFVQANYLESYGPFPILGRLGENDVEEITEAGQAFLSKSNPTMQTNDGLRILVASEPFARAISAERISSEIGRNAASRGFKVIRKELPEHGVGTVRTLVTSMNGRYESVSIQTDDGRSTEMIGILPGENVIIQDSEYGDDVIVKALDLGYRKFTVCGANLQSHMETAVEDPRFAQSSFTYLFEDQSSEDDVLDRIGFDASVKQSDMVFLFINSCTEETETILTRLQEQRKPAVLISTDADIDSAFYLRTFPVLRDVVVCTADRETYRDALSKSVQAAISKMTATDIANVNPV